MGVFNITPRSKQLGNIQGGGVRRVNVPNYHIGSGSAEMWRAAGRLGRDIMSAGKDMAYIAGDMRREQRMIQDAETETAFVDAMRSKIEDPENGLLGRVRTAGNSEALQGCVTEGQDYFRTAAEELLKDKGYSGDRKQKMLMRLKEAASPFQRAMAHGVLAKTQELKVSAADRNFNTLLETWKSNMTDEDATRAAIDSYRASQRARGLSDDTVEINTDKILRGMAYDYTSHNVGIATRQQLGWLENEIGKDGCGQIFAFNPILAEYFDGKDPLKHTVATSSGAAVSAKDGLKTLIASRRHQLDDLDQARISAISAPGFEASNTIWDPNNPTQRNPDRLTGTERAIEGLRKELEAKSQDGKKLLQDGSSARAAAVRNLSILEQSADAIAGEELMMSLLDGYRKNPNNPPRIWIEEERDKNGKVIKEAHAADDILKNSRKARLAQQVQAQFDKSIEPETTARHRDKVAELKMAQFDLAAKRGDYHKRILDAALAGEISLYEWDELRTGFDETWTKGSDGKISQKQLFARNALSIIQKVFGGDLSEAYQYNQKSGKIEPIKGSTYEGLTYGAEWTSGGMLSILPILTPTGKLTALDVGELAEWGAELARYDGEVLTRDPITGSDKETYFGEKIDPTKAEPFNASAYFEKIVRKMKDDIYVDEKTDYIYDVALGVQRLQNEDAARRDSERKSITSRPDKKKEVIIKKPNTKAVGVATKK